MDRKSMLGRVIVIVSAVCAVMIFVESVLQPTYVAKSLIKVVLFVGGIRVYGLNTKQPIVSFVYKAKELKQILILAIGVYASILICFFLLMDIIDINQIRDSLMGKEGIHKDNFIFVAAYISVVNSFIEELFFRGFAFQELKKLNFQRFSYIFSAGAFSLYHIGIISGWFSAPMLLMMIGGLFAAGLVLNLLCQYADSILGSWAIHISANLAINTIGFMIL